jgi:hypothetical protein
LRCLNFNQNFKRHDLEQKAIKLRQRILQYTRVPVCIGISAAKTLAKIANKIAKQRCRTSRTFCMDTQEKINVKQLGPFSVIEKPNLEIMQQKKNTSPFLGNITENYQVEYWAGKFGVRPNVLREIMKTTGSELSELQKYFNK